EIKKSLGESEVAPTRQEELVRLFLAKKLGEELPQVRGEVKRIFESLAKVPSSEGEVTDVTELLTSSRVPPKTKALWLESQLASGLKFLERKDLVDARKKAEAPPSEEVMKKKEESPEQNVPPPASDSFRPSMEEMERSKEGEPGAFFTVAPFFGGYYKEGDYETWNQKTLSWERHGRSLKNLGKTEFDEKTRRMIAGTIRPGTETALPMPYGFRPDAKTLKINGKGKIEILEDGHGGYVLQTKGDALTSFSVELARGATSEEEKAGQLLKLDTGKLSKETEAKLDEIKKLKAPAPDKARLLKQYVKHALRYSNESAMNAVYQGGNPKDYFRRIEEHKRADCDVANTYFAALLSRLEIPVRMVTGHYVQVKNRQGNAALSSGTGHAWVEFWNGTSWERLDATPPGDPNMDDEEMDENRDDSVLEGDFGEQEAEEISKEELEKMIAEAKAELDKKEGKKGETAALRFAEDAGCTPEEAKEILKQIEVARELRDKRGRRIRARIIAEFQKIVKDNMVERLRYKSPVRLPDAHELVDPVEAALDIEAGEA
ncbi:MAG: transglutaminase domain-containing protein, partial [Patescibacteria group bacterium]